MHKHTNNQVSKRTDKQTEITAKQHVLELKQRNEHKACPHAYGSLRKEHTNEMDQMRWHCWLRPHTACGHPGLLFSIPVAGDCPAAAVVTAATAAGKDRSSSAAEIALRVAAGTA